MAYNNYYFITGSFYDDELQDLISESLKMKELRHPNVVNLLGVCLDAGPAPYIVLPYMANGDLLSYLRQHKDCLLVAKDSEENKVLKSLISVVFDYIPS